MCAEWAAQCELLIPTQSRVFTVLTVGVREAKSHLSRLLREVSAGEEIIITRSGHPVARLVAIEDARPVFGVDEGRFVVPDDFDQPLDEELLRRFAGCD